MQTSINRVIRDAIQRRMRMLEHFTAFDISRELKTMCLPIRHRLVAEIIRDMYECGEMVSFDYDRFLATVQVDNHPVLHVFIYHRRDRVCEEYASSKSEPGCPCRYMIGSED